MEILIAFLGVGILSALIVIMVELYDIDKEMHLIEKDLKHYKRRVK